MEEVESGADKKEHHSTDYYFLLYMSRSEKNLQAWFVIIFSAMMFGLGYGVRKQAMIFLNDAYYGAMVGAITSLMLSRR